MKCIAPYRNDGLPVSSYTEWITTSRANIGVKVRLKYSVQANNYTSILTPCTRSLALLTDSEPVSLTQPQPDACGEIFSLIWLASSISVIGGLFLDLATTLLIMLRHSHLAHEGIWIILMGIVPLSLRFPLLSMWVKMDEICDWVKKVTWAQRLNSWALNMTGGCVFLR